jgi:hypothetical protein
MNASPNCGAQRTRNRRSTGWAAHTRASGGRAQLRHSVALGRGCGHWFEQHPYPDACGMAFTLDPARESHDQRYSQCGSCPDSTETPATIHATPAIDLRSGDGDDPSKHLIVVT